MDGLGCIGGGNPLNSDLVRASGDGEGPSGGIVRVGVANDGADGCHIELLNVRAIVEVEGLISVDGDRLGAARTVPEEDKADVRPEVCEVEDK